MSTTTHSVFLSSCVCLESSLVLSSTAEILVCRRFWREGRIHFRIELLLLVELRRWVGLFCTIRRRRVHDRRLKESRRECAASAQQQRAVVVSAYDLTTPGQSSSPPPAEAAAG